MDEATLKTVDLDTPIVRGEETIGSLTMRKPNSGELRGLSLAKLGQADVTEILKLLPRITINPTITEVEANAIDPADLMEVADKLGDFFLTKRRLEEFRTT